MQAFGLRMTDRARSEHPSISGDNRSLARRPRTSRVCESSSGDFNVREDNSQQLRVTIPLRFSEISRNRFFAVQVISSNERRYLYFAHFSPLIFGP